MDQSASRISWRLVLHVRPSRKVPRDLYWRKWKRNRPCYPSMHRSAVNQMMMTSRTMTSHPNPNPMTSHPMTSHPNPMTSQGHVTNSLNFSQTPGSDCATGRQLLTAPQTPGNDRATGSQQWAPPQTPGSDRATGSQEMIPILLYCTMQ